MDVIEGDTIMEPVRPVSHAQVIQGASTALREDSDFGAWLIVSRRHGRACGSGTGTRASHVTIGVAADVTPANCDFQNTHSRGSAPS